MVGQAVGFVERDVPGQHEGGVRGAVVAGVEVGDVVAGEGLDAVERADGGFAVGLVAVEEARADAACDGDGGVGFLADGDEALAAETFEVFCGEGWVLDDVGEEIDAGVGVVGEKGDSGQGRVHGCVGAEARADAIGGFGELGCVTGLGAFVEECCGEGRESGLGGRVVFAAGASDDSG